jgi:hypothetical protein
VVGDLRDGLRRTNGAALLRGRLVEAGKQFRRVNSRMHLSTLRAAMERETAQSVGLVVHNDQVSAA